MRAHGFALIASPSALTDDAVNAILEEGCDDCTVRVSEGVGRIEFDREARSLLAAVLSALDAVERAARRIGAVVNHLPSENSGQSPAEHMSPVVCPSGCGVSG